ncbi:MAG: 30S ribosome-binding factor RbfA [Pseudomonadota bacterium]
MPKNPNHRSGEPSQRQLRAGELIRHALVDILAREDLRDPALQGVSVTIGEVRASPDLKQAVVFCAPLGDRDLDHAREVAAGLNRAARFLRGRLGREIDMKFTPELRFLADESYEAAAEMNALLASPEIRPDWTDDD